MPENYYPATRRDKQGRALAFSTTSDRVFNPTTGASVKAEMGEVSSLSTIAKTVVPAINENKASIDTLNLNLVQPAAISNNASCSLINHWSSANLTFRKVGNSVLFNMHYQNGLNPMTSGTQIGTAPYAAAETTSIPCLVADSGGTPVSQFAHISIDTDGVMRVWSNTSIPFKYWIYVNGTYLTA